MVSLMQHTATTSHSKRSRSAMSERPMRMRGGVRTLAFTRAKAFGDHGAQITVARFVLGGVARAAHHD